jgi:hypothetical protein
MAKAYPLRPLRTCPSSFPTCAGQQETVLGFNQVKDRIVASILSFSGIQRPALLPYTGWGSPRAASYCCFSLFISRASADLEFLRMLCFSWQLAAEVLQSLFFYRLDINQLSALLVTNRWPNLLKAQKSPKHYFCRDGIFHHPTKLLYCLVIQLCPIKFPKVSGHLDQCTVVVKNLSSRITRWVISASPRTSYVTLGKSRSCIVPLFSLLKKW